MRGIWIVALLAGMAGVAAAEESAFVFEHHSIHVGLPAPGGVGDYGQTALVDIDKDGKLDFVLGKKGGTLYWFGYEGPDKWTMHEVGKDTQSDVGLAAMDVDGDGWIDLVCSGVWYKNPGNPREKAFIRHVFDGPNKGAHDVLAVDVDGDGKIDICSKIWGPRPFNGVGGKMHVDFLRNISPNAEKR